MVVMLLLACAGESDKDDETGGRPVSAEPSAELGGELVVFVGVDADFSAGTSVGDRFVWDFGDGGTATGSDVTHTYTEPGRYTVRLTAESDDGRSDTASMSRVAVYEPLATPPSQSGRLALLDGVLYAAIPDADEVVVVSGDVVVDRLAVCGHPVSVSAADGVLAVACQDDAVELWDTTTRQRISNWDLPWGSRPVAVAAGPGGAVLALAGTGEAAWVTLNEVTDLGAAPDPGAVAWSGDSVFLPRFRSPVDAGEVRWLYPGASETFSLLPDPGPDSDTDARGLPNLLGAAALSPDGRGLVVAGAKANMDRGLLRDGLALGNDTTTRSALRLIDAQTGAPVARALFDNRDRVGAVAYTPLGDKLFAAHLGARIVDVLDPLTLARIGGFQDVGLGLDGMATDGDTLWVLASLDRQLVSYDLRVGNEEIELARVDLVAEEPLDATLLLGARVFTDAADPRMSTDAYVSCASCHPDGATDARTWDFTDRGEGLRDTQALFAMPPDGPFHWSANFDELQDFENAIRAFQAGQGFLSDEDFATCEDPLGTPKAGLSEELDALAAYIRSFPVPRSPWRNADGTNSESAVRGREVFLAEGCDTCHAGVLTSDAGWVDGEPVLHDVGTLLDTSGDRAGGPLTGLRTPTLRGLFATAPYLHDGRAATLEEALAIHGVSTDPDLVRYLLEIEGEE